MSAPKDKISQYQFIIQEGFRLLKEQKAYRQVNVLKKLITLDQEVSPTSFSNILKGKAVGNEVLRKAGKGMLSILEKELGYVFSEKKCSFFQDVSLQDSLEIVDEYHRKGGLSKGVLFRADGRLSISEKVAFLETAKREIVEVGIRLNTFSNYFLSRKEKDFALPIKNLLTQGVNIKLYLLNPDYNGTHFYFNDRAIVQEEEKQSAERIKSVIQQLKKIYQLYQFEELSGRFEVYTYRHLPYAHFLITDGNKREGRMIVSQYLYGVPRAHCPSVEVNKIDDPALYRKYWTSYQLLVADAQLLDLS